MYFPVGLSFSASAPATMAGGLYGWTSLVAMSSSFYNEKMFGLSNAVITLSTLISLPILYVFLYQSCKRIRLNIVQLQTKASTAKPNKPMASTLRTSKRKNTDIDGNKKAGNSGLASIEASVKSSSSGTALPPPLTKNIGDINNVKSPKPDLLTSQNGSSSFTTEANTATSVQDSKINSDAEIHEKKRQTKMVRKILVLMSTYFMCSLVFAPVGFFRERLSDALFYTVKAIFLSNSIFNPIIYVLTNKNFRAVLKEMFGLS